MPEGLGFRIAMIITLLMTKCDKATTRSLHMSGKPDMSRDDDHYFFLFSQTWQQSIARPAASGRAAERIPHPYSRADDNARSLNGVSE